MAATFKAVDLSRSCQFEVSIALSEAAARLAELNDVTRAIEMLLEADSLAKEQYGPKSAARRQVTDLLKSCQKKSQLKMSVRLALPGLANFRICRGCDSVKPLGVMGCCSQCCDAYFCSASCLEEHWTDHIQACIPALVMLPQKQNQNCAGCQSAAAVLFCGLCRDTAYCSVSCQLKEWPAHGRLCSGRPHLVMLESAPVIRDQSRQSPDGTPAPVPGRKRDRSSDTSSGTKASPPTRPRKKEPKIVIDLVDE